MNYESNMQTVLTDLNRKLLKVADVSKLQRTIGTYLFADNWIRITEGIAVDMQPIGTYSTKGIYINPAKAPRKFSSPPEGKYGERIFKTGKKKGQPHKTKYFKGYKGYRAEVGRESGFVNLQLTNKLRLDWSIYQGNTDYSNIAKSGALPNTQTPNGDWTIGFKTQYGKDVSHGNEQHFGCQIFGVTAKNFTDIEKIETDFVKKSLEN